MTFGGYRYDNIYKTTDGGTNWQSITSGIPAIPVRGVVRHPRNARQLYAATDAGVYESNDGGLNWVTSSQGPDDVAVDEVAFVTGSERLLAATHGRGLWTADTSGVACLYRLSPASGSFPNASATGSFNVIADPRCSWTAVVDAAASQWLHVTSGLSGTGNGIVSFTVDANTTGHTRSAAITVGGQRFVVIQAVGCDVTSLTPTGGFYSSQGGTATFDVAADSQCAWTATVDPVAADWITIIAPATGATVSGNGTVSFRINANTAPGTPGNPTSASLPRFGNIVINQRVFVVNQMGLTPPICPMDGNNQPTFAIEGPSTIRPDQNLSLVAYPGAGFHYRWIMSPPPDGQNGIIGNDSPTLFIRPDNGNPYYPKRDTSTTYYVLVTSANCPNGVLVSFTVTVTGSPASCLLPTGTSTGLTLSPGAGQPVSIGVGPEPPYFPWYPEKPAFQWYRGASGDLSSPINGETSDSLIVRPTVDSMYWVKMTTSCGGVQLGNTSLVVLGIPPRRRAVKHNSLGIGKTELLFRNPVTGANVIQPIDGATVIPPVPLPSFDPAWQAQTISDLNGDERADIVWRNPASGANAYWAMAGATVLANIPIETKDPAWNVAASADFTDSGHMDLVWQNRETNDLELWLMDGAQHAGSFGLGRLPADWVLQGSADFDHDDKPDVVFRNYRTGQNAIWHMDDAKPPGFAGLGEVISNPTSSTTGSKLTMKTTATSSDGMPGVIESLPDTNWRMASIDDADGDGQPDIIWINSATNEMMYWKMAGMTHVATTQLPPQTDPNLKIAGTPPIDIVPQTQATALTVSATAATFGGSTTLHATLSANGAPVAGESIAFSIDGASAGSAFTVADGTASIAASVTGLATGTHNASAQFAGDTTYGLSSASSSLQILPQPVQITWLTPAPIVYGTPLGSAQLAAAATVSGTFVYTPAAGTILGGGANQQLTVTFTPVDTVNYMAATASVAMTVIKAAQTITWATPDDITYGTAISSAQLNASVLIPGPASAGILSYDAALGTILSAGDHVLTATAAATANYNAGIANVTLHIRQATPSVTWAAPAAITYGTPLSGTQLNAAASVPGTVVYAPSPGSVLTAGDHVLQVTFTPTNASDFTAVTANVSLTVLKATPTLQWPQPSDIVYGTPLSGTQLNATSSIAGSFVYSPKAGTILNAGASQPLQTVFTPADTLNFTTATATGQVNVLKAPQSIAWPPPTAITYGAPLSGAQLNAVVNVPGPSPAGAVTYAPAAGTVLQAGTATLTAVAAETPNYTAASASAALIVRKATPSIAWPAPAAIAYGTALSANQLNATANVDGTFAYNPAAGTILHAGTQQLQAVFTPSDGQDYENATGTVTLTVNKAPQQLTWTTPGAIVYGTPLSATQLNATVSVIGPAPAGALTYTPALASVLDAGAQPLTVMAAETPDYLSATRTVTLTVTQAPLSVTAANAAKRYGAPLPILSGVLTGVVNNDPLTPVFATTASLNSPAGTYPITAGIADPNGRLRNYAVTTTGATLTVTPAPLSITVINVSKQYSDPLPPFGATYNGFVLGETPAVLSGMLTFANTVTMTTAPGQYPLAVSGVSSPNYAIQFIPGTILVTPEDARVTFTGSRIASTTGLTTGTTAVALSATVADISATPDSNGDTWLGGISNATLTFVDRTTNATLCTAPLGLMRPDVLTIASGTCIWTAPLTATRTVTIGVVIGGYYNRDTAADDTPLLLQVPTTDHFVTGGGFLIATMSAGDLAADVSSRITMNVDARYNKGQTLLHGNIDMQVQHKDSTGSHRTYQISAPSLSSIGINDTQTAATITGANVTITDVTDAKTPVLIASNAILVLTASQPDKAHAATIGVTLLKPTGGLWLATNSSGMQTVEQTLDGGAIQIH
ncbi:MAG: hypothetical protein QOC81_4885 [Thermoanaerobaculia bacterium]|nr:hypothetical protein [Thermoanaerobaculia bacterium]